MTLISNIGGRDGLTVPDQRKAGFETGGFIAGILKYRLTFTFAVVMVISIIIAAFFVNLIVGSLAETHLIRIAQDTTAQYMVHVQSMMSEPRLEDPDVPVDHLPDRGGVSNATARPDLDRWLSGNALSTNYSNMVIGMHIVKLNVLNLDGRVVWSSDRDNPGAIRKSNPRFIAAAAGATRSVLIRGNDAEQTNEVIPAEPPQTLKTFLPLREAPTGPIIGVIEVDRDVTDDVALGVGDARAAVLLATTGTLGALFFIFLSFIVVADGSIIRSNQREKLVIEEANRNLEEKVLERTRELNAANQRLVETQDQLVRTEKLAVIGQLAGGVAHDLRNPLGAIKNAIFYLNRKLATTEEARSNPRVAQFLQIIEDEVSHSNQIITDLLTFTRINTPSLSATNLTQVIDSALASLEANDRIRIIKVFDPDLAAVPVDGEQIQRVFANLALNAFEAMPEGGELKIITRQDEGFAEVIFQDTGEGIGDEILKNIFEPLYTTKTKGTGLGLAVCQQVVAKHQGTIQASSQKGIGSIFTVRLPLPGSENPTSKELV
jgi:signal transduction histidine kinase